ncbi:MAG: anthranilate/aminodeoxychorismate synthase component II [Deltaproteobacteria bacterium]|nr:MAG: anthranilate/aminodeoxychorismate synthase component II [Deltaproteobacteria bacterium]
MILMIDNYDSFTYNLVQVFGNSGETVEVVRNDEICTERLRRLRPDRLVVSPGPGVPAGAGITLFSIRYFAGKIPILGVCLGHQAIGEAFGGRVVRADRLMHGKVSTIYHDGKGCYRGVSQPFEATRYHSLVLERSTLPACLKVVSETDRGEIMGIRHRKLPIEGVQFHPESILTKEGEKILLNFLRQ